MATVNFSVPDDVKEAFDAAFAGQNKSAIIARLMAEAVEHKAQQERRARAMEGILELRKEHRPASNAAIRRARINGRP